MDQNTQHKSSVSALMLGAIGIVYGDIGTSVLYSVQTVFHLNKLPVNEANVFGIVSLFFWTLTLIVSFKYVLMILRADNHGEGGLVAMLALVSRSLTDQPKLRYVLLLLGIAGACLFYGDGVITPAISVLAAVEGLEVASRAFKEYVIPLTLIILLALFVFQKKGTAGIGKFFGPIMLLWFLAIGALGVAQIVQRPDILQALNPLYAMRFVAAQPLTTFFILGAVVLCVTGGEALYADMGHFGRRPIQLAWFFVVMPPLVLNYLGQGALLLREPGATANPFFMMVPKWALYPMVGLATAATVIASQALISGAFSATKQIIQLGYLPRLQILHTNEYESGQIYMPFVNWALFVAIVAVVIMFRTSENLAGAYGIAVTTNMVITSIMAYFVMRHVWKWHVVVALALTAFFLAVDGAFWFSNMAKILEGGWFPLFIAAVLFVLMLTWYRGRQLIAEKRAGNSLNLKEFLQSVFAAPPQRVAGTAVFMHPQDVSVPNALLHNLKHNKVLHAQNLFVALHYHEVPWVDVQERLKVHPLGNACWQVEVHYGFMDEVDLPKALAPLHEHGIELDPMRTSYFLSRDTVVSTDQPGMARWRERLFAQMHYNATSMAAYMSLPTNAVVEMGGKVEI
ncbi:MAG: potassium transporter Kup [Brachymonas sp.]|nr:potassium transporter Kup [Brachymonas sp.]